MRATFYGIGCAALALALAGEARAEEADTPGTIIVTGSKRGLPVEDTDGQVAVLSGEALTRSGLLDLDQIGQLAGDLTIRQRGNRAYDSVTLRGQSSVDFYNPTVQFYIDGVPQDQASFGQVLPLGVRQVEILYGPQGTLYGRGAIGGVVNVVTAPPEGTAFEAQGLWGERTRDVSAQGGITLVPQTLFADIAYGYQDRDGEYRAYADGSRLGDSETYHGRVRLRYAPVGSPFSALVSYARQVRRSSEEQYVLASDLDTRTAYPVENSYRLTHDVASLKLDYDLGGASLSSITSYQTRDYDRVVFGIASPETQETVTQELRLATQGERRLSYVAGLYFEQTDFTVARPDYGQTASQRLRSIAAFGEATLAITSRLDLTGGARLDFHKVRAKAGYAGAETGNEANFTGFSPKLALGYKLGERTRIYALVSSGFKAGGFTRFVTPATISYSYEPEKVLNGEVGLRTRTANDQLGLSLAAYYTRNRDYQYYVGYQPNQYLQNVGDVESRGIEGRLDWQPGAGWSFDATLAYNRATFTRYDNPANPGTDLTGATLPYAPRWTGRAALARAIDLPSGLGTLRLQAGATYASRIYFDETNTFGQGGYALFDAGISWVPNRHWAIELAANNIGDKLYAPYGFALAPGMNVYQLGAGRELSLRLRTRF